jgi:hypothetical protein
MIIKVHFIYSNSIFTFSFQVLETCDLSWKRSNSDDYEQCSIIGAFRTSKLNLKSNEINENEKYLMSIVKMNSLDRTLIIDNEYSKEEFTMHFNIYGKFIFVDSKFKTNFYLIIFILI